LFASIFFRWTNHIASVHIRITNKLIEWAVERIEETTAGQRRDRWNQIMNDKKEN
jgi:hypothetical protein